MQYVVCVGKWMAFNFTKSICSFPQIIHPKTCIYKIIFTLSFHCLYYILRFFKVSYNHYVFQQKCASRYPVPYSSHHASCLKNSIFMRLNTYQYELKQFELQLFNFCRLSTCKHMAILPRIKICRLCCIDYLLLKEMYNFFTIRISILMVKPW